MNLSRNIATVALGLVVSVGASAQALKVATGGNGQTYSTMFREVGQMCASTITLNEQQTSGSIENVDLLIGNKVNGAFVQADVLFYRALTENMNGIKTLYALHPEEIHLITLAISKTKEGGKFGIGAKQVVLTDITSLANRRVGAWGGSLITAEVIQQQAGIPFNFQDVSGGDNAIKMLNDGQIDAILAVGGAPMSFIEKLDATYKLLPIPASIAAKLKQVYTPTKISYGRMGQGGRGVETVATDALFVTREYKSERFVSQLASLRSCLDNSLTELQETTGKHAKWQDVKRGVKGKWPMYELPAAGPINSVVPPAPIRRP